MGIRDGDDGLRCIRDYSAVRGPQGEWCMNHQNPICTKGDFQEDWELSEWAFKQARRIYEKEGRIKSGEPFFRVVGTMHMSPETFHGD